MIKLGPHTIWLLAVAIAGCQPVVHYPTVTPASVQRMVAGSITLTSAADAIVLSITDGFGDCHLMRLDYAPMSRAAALEFVRHEQLRLAQGQPAPRGRRAARARPA